MNRLPVSAIPCPLLMALILVSAGCRTETPASFEENLVHAKKWELQSGVPMDQVVADTNWALHELFGTPDQPKLPAVLADNEEFAALVSLDRLQAAAGPHLEQGRGLYREHCARCHGISGNGRGETAALVDPYPRDYRLGIFKFKSTHRGAKPLKADLARVIKFGIPGSSMVPDYQLSPTELGPLPDEAVDALADYVIYLSIRGETERSLYDAAAMELDLEGGDRIVDPSLAHLANAEIGEPTVENYNRLDEDELAQLSAAEQQNIRDYKAKEQFTEQWELIEEVVEEIADSWVSAEDQLVEVEIPEQIPVPRSHEELTTMLAGAQSRALHDSIERGRELFVGAVASCAKCHGQDGRGDGQEADYDDWTKDWTTRIGLKPEDHASLVPLMARGALSPRTIKPRNFEEGIFRGGAEPEDLYRRLNQGIAGTPMPAVTTVPGQLEEVDVWHLINYVRSLGKPDPSAVTEQQPTIAGLPPSSK
jgi:mono/diheme cytochrome c family protein